MRAAPHLAQHQHDIIVLQTLLHAVRAIPHNALPRHSLSSAHNLSRTLKMANATLHTSDLVSRDSALIHHLADLNATCATIAQDLAYSAFDLLSLTRVNQKVIVALATLQSSVQDLSLAYINHANTVLNPGRSGPLDVGLTNTLVEAGLRG